MNVMIGPTQSQKPPGTLALRRRRATMPPTGGTATTVENAGRRLFLGTAAASAIAFGGSAAFAQPFVTDSAERPAPAADPVLAEALRQVRDGVASALDQHDAARSAAGFQSAVNGLKIVRAQAQAIDAYREIPSWVQGEVHRRGRPAVIADGLNPACCDWVALLGDAHRSGAAHALGSPTPELVATGLDAVLNGLFSPKLVDLACTSFESAGRAVAAYHAQRVVEPAVVRPVALRSGMSAAEDGWDEMVGLYEELQTILQEEGYMDALSPYYTHQVLPDAGIIDCSKLDRAIALVGALVGLACAWGWVFPPAAAMCALYMIVEAFLLILKAFAC